jgi:hypothetical protein
MPIATRPAAQGCSGGRATCFAPRRASVLARPGSRECAASREPFPLRWARSRAFVCRSRAASRGRRRRRARASVSLRNGGFRRSPDNRLGSALKVTRCRLNGEFAGKALQESPPRRRVACVSSMAAEARTADAGYTNRPAIHAQALWRVRLENHAGRQATGRAGDRMLLALRAYEQRAQRRAALHGWLVARSALTSRT